MTMQLRRLLTVAASLAIAGSSLLASTATAATIAPAPRLATGIAVTTVNATVKDDMTITLDRYWAPAGLVNFFVTNAGAVTHELVVLQTTLLADKLPSDPDEPAKALEDIHMGETEDIDPGHFTGFAVGLGPGHYSIICNEPGHYMAGMHVDFTVTAPLVNISLDDTMTIGTDQTTVYAGPVVFAVSNNGKFEHELVVLRTYLPASQIPVDPTDPAIVSEEWNIGETGDIDPGHFSGFELTLAPGRYLLICNEPGHFASGMHIVLTVLGDPTTDEPAN